MGWHDIIFVVHGPASKMSETETPRIFDIRLIPVPGHALGHFLHLNLKEITAYSARCHDGARATISVAVETKKKRYYPIITRKYATKQQIHTPKLGK